MNSRSFTSVLGALILSLFVSGATVFAADCRDLLEEPLKADLISINANFQYELDIVHSPEPGTPAVIILSEDPVKTKGKARLGEEFLETHDEQFALISVDPQHHEGLFFRSGYNLMISVKKYQRILTSLFFKRGHRLTDQLIKQDPAQVMDLMGSWSPGRMSHVSSVTSQILAANFYAVVGITTSGLAVSLAGGDVSQFYDNNFWWLIDFYESVGWALAQPVELGLSLLNIDEQLVADWYDYYSENLPYLKTGGLTGLGVALFLSRSLRRGLYNLLMLIPGRAINENKSRHMADEIKKWVEANPGEKPLLVVSQTGSTIARHLIQHHNYRSEDLNGIYDSIQTEETRRKLKTRVRKGIMGMFDYLRRKFEP